MYHLLARAAIRTLGVGGGGGKGCARYRPNLSLTTDMMRRHVVFASCVCASCVCLYVWPMPSSVCGSCVSVCWCVCLAAWLPLCRCVMAGCDVRDYVCDDVCDCDCVCLLRV